jgi:hypothetical protein
MRAFVPVYLDGDTEEAQRWGEELKTSAYPTILILSSEREELFRLNGTVDIDELERAAKAVVGESRSFKAAVERLDAGALTADDARILAHADWEQLPEPAWGPARRLAVLSRAADRCPSELRRERALLASSLLSLAAVSKGIGDLARPRADVAAKAPAYLDAVFADADTQWAARLFINHRAGDTATLLHEGRRDEAYEALKKRWLAAAAAIGAREDASVDVRLWSVIPALDFYRYESPEGEPPRALRTSIEEAVTLADTRARSSHERQSVISGAAYILRRVGAHDRARAMLIAEAERSSAPYYYQGSLASLEEALGRTEEARAWSAKARKSAAGSATRLQWIASDIVLNAKLEGPDQMSSLKSAAEEFYGLATSLRDGFSGRNRTRADQVKSALTPHRADPGLAALFARYRPRCDALSGENQKGCVAHFEGLL